jgi:hypothetical protein
MPSRCTRRVSELQIGAAPRDDSPAPVSIAQQAIGVPAVDPAFDHNAF